MPSISRGIKTPGIKNEPECLSCHEESRNHLGGLIEDVSLANLEQQLLDYITRTLILSIVTALLVATIAYYMIQSLVVRRIETMNAPIAALRAGDFTTRVPMRKRNVDELDDLARGLNHMAAEIERHELEQEKRTEVRERAISEERDRIARELHDGFSQLLSFINTKISAVRLLLINKQFMPADKLLLQLEEATQSLFLDVREAILGLKMSGQVGENLGIALKECTAQFSRFSDLPIDLNLDPKIENLTLDAETELHLLRIIQESLTNIRKHAKANKIQVDLWLNNGGLDLAICDDGTGFLSDAEFDRQHFGLSTMRERATAIGARIDILSEIGSGTCVNLQLPIKEN
jgi:signal transduction histidine kinase